MQPTTPLASGSGSAPHSPSLSPPTPTYHLYSQSERAATRKANGGRLPEHIHDGDDYSQSERRAMRKKQESREREFLRVAKEAREAKEAAKKAQGVRAVAQAEATVEVPDSQNGAASMSPAAQDTAQTSAPGPSAAPAATSAPIGPPDTDGPKPDDPVPPPLLAPHEIAQATYLTQSLDAMHATKAALEAENRRLREMCGRVLVKVLPALSGQAGTLGQGGAAQASTSAVEGLQDISSMAATMGDDQFAALAGAVASLLPQSQAGPDPADKGEQRHRRAPADPEAVLKDEKFGRVLLENMERERNDLLRRAVRSGAIKADGQLAKSATSVKVSSENDRASPPDLALLQSIHVHMRTLLAASRSKNQSLKQALSAAPARRQGEDPARDAEDWRTGVEVIKAARDVRAYIDSIIRVLRDGPHSSDTATVVEAIPSPLAHPNPAFSSLAHSLPIPLGAGQHSAAGTTSLPIALHPAFIPAIYNKRKGRPTREVQESKRAGLRLGVWGGSVVDQRATAFEDDFAQLKPAKRGPKPKPKAEGDEVKPKSRRGRRSKAEMEASKAAPPAPIRVSKRDRRAATQGQAGGVEHPQETPPTSASIISPTAIPYPDPPNPDVPARDPANPLFSTQIPYQLQIRSMIADGRWPDGDTAGPGGHQVNGMGEDGGDMTSLLVAASHNQAGAAQHGTYNHQPVEGMQGHEFLTQEHDGDGAQRADLLLTVPRDATNINDAMQLAHAEGLYGASVSASQYIRGGQPEPYQPWQSRRNTKRKRTSDGELSDGGVTTTCPNCATVITAVWRKLTVCGHEYRVCNACALHYAKNGVMRPEALWPKAGEEPKKRRHRQPRAKRTQPAEGEGEDAAHARSQPQPSGEQEPAAAEEPAEHTAQVEEQHASEENVPMEEDYRFDVVHPGDGAADYDGMGMDVGFAQQLVYTAQSLQHAGDAAQHVG